jgi:hypothetical protein
MVPSLESIIAFGAFGKRYEVLAKETVSKIKPMLKEVQYAQSRSERPIIVIFYRVQYVNAPETANTHIHIRMKGTVERPNNPTC